MADETWSGGCQCGAVRYMFSVRPDNPCICHCHMCQKQFGNFFGAFAGSHQDNFRLTRGSLARFKSSIDGYRGFCRDCGTPLTYEAISKLRIDVSIGSLDRHSEMIPLFNYGGESMEPWLLEALSRPCTVTGVGDNGIGDTPERYALVKKTNHQHPDHDTAQWTPHNP
jgi:hypothetical protein